MGCNCDYMEPTREELECSRLACLIDELDGIPIDKNRWEGFHPKIYCQTYDKYNSPYNKGEMLYKLLARLRSDDVTRYSLEMQIWWRDYLKVEKEKTKTNNQKEKDKIDKAKAYNKLTDQERKLLGI